MPPNILIVIRRRTQMRTHPIPVPKVSGAIFHHQIENTDVARSTLIVIPENDFQFGQLVAEIPKDGRCLSAMGEISVVVQLTRFHVDFHAIGSMAR